jgi:hypothetical protein
MASAPASIPANPPIRPQLFLLRDKDSDPAIGFSA